MLSVNTCQLEQRTGENIATSSHPLASTFALATNRPWNSAWPYSVTLLLPELITFWGEFGVEFVVYTRADSLYCVPAGGRFTNSVPRGEIVSRGKSRFCNWNHRCHYCDVCSHRHPCPHCAPGIREQTLYSTRPSHSLHSVYGFNTECPGRAAGNHRRCVWEKYREKMVLRPPLDYGHSQIIRDSGTPIEGRSIDDGRGE